MAIKDGEQELETELETELDSADETEIDAGTPDAADGSDTESKAGGTEGAGEPKPTPTVEDAIAEALKALEPKTPESIAADKLAADKVVADAAAKKSGTKTADEPKLDADGKPIVEGKKEPDHLNDPISPLLRESTQTRMRALIDTVKSQAVEVENQGAIIAAIQETGATPQEFGAMITYMKYVHSDKPSDLESAYAMLQGGLRTIANKLGRSLPEVDVLEGHPDLVEAVTSGQTTKKIAEEVAIARNRATASASSDAAMQTAAQTEAAAKQEKDKAITELNAIGADLKTRDPNYQAKYDSIVPALQATFAHLQPRFWKQAFNSAYAACKATARPALVVTPPATPKGQPLRPAAPAGGGKREAKTIEDAMFGEGFPE